MAVVNMMDPTNTNTQGRLVDWLWNKDRERLTYMGKLQVDCPLCKKAKLRWYRVWLWDVGDCLYAHEMCVCLLCQKATYPTWISDKHITKKQVSKIIDTKPLKETVLIKEAG